MQHCYYNLLATRNTSDIFITKVYYAIGLWKTIFNMRSLKFVLILIINICVITLHNKTVANLFEKYDI